MAQGSWGNSLPRGHVCIPLVVRLLDEEIRESVHSWIISAARWVIFDTRREKAGAVLPSSSSQCWRGGYNRCYCSPVSDRSRPWMLTRQSFHFREIPDDRECFNAWFFSSAVPSNQRLIRSRPLKSTSFVRMRTDFVWTVSGKHWPAVRCFCVRKVYVAFRTAIFNTEMRYTDQSPPGRVARQPEVIRNSWDVTWVSLLPERYVKTSTSQGITVPRRPALIIPHIISRFVPIVNLCNRFFVMILPPCIEAGVAYDDHMWRHSAGFSLAIV